MRAESLRSRHAALMSVDQARHRQRTVEAVLGVVVPGVAAGIAGQGARVQAAEGLERVAQRSQIGLRMQHGEQCADRGADVVRMRDAYQVGAAVMKIGRASSRGKVGVYV